MAAGYVPWLRWKQGEYQALYRLSNEAKRSIVPLIEIAEIGYDFESKTPSKSIDEHLEKVAKRISDKWGSRPCFVDIRLVASERMADGQHPMEFLFNDLRAKSVSAIPTIDPEMDAEWLHAVRVAVRLDSRGVCVRAQLEQVAKQDFGLSLNAVLTGAGVAPDVCDLIIDIGAPNFEPIAGFATLLGTLLGTLPHLNEWRTLTLMGTSFPQTMAAVPAGLSTIPRHEWALYQLVVKGLAARGLRIPRFGDYAINHPSVSTLDMRFVKPKASLRYTTGDGWLIARGRNVRDHGYDQYRQHCRLIVTSPHFLGPKFSKGDQYISECASGAGSTGNLTTWRWVGTNHHLERVVRDLANQASAAASS